MAATKARGLIAYRDYTHSLVIQMDASSFHSQSETSFQRFRKDTLIANIPEKANNPQAHSNKLLFGRLKLGSLQRREKFSKVLHSLDYSKLIGPAPENAQSSSVAREHIDTAPSPSHVAPLRVNLSGLNTNWPDPSVTRMLYLSSVDPTGRLHPFIRSLIDIFTKAGFPILEPTRGLSLSLVTSQLIHWGGPYPFVVLPNGSKRYREFRHPTFDARELLKKYENETWATDVRLERLSLLGVGATERNPDGVKVFKEQPEIDSVALP